ncbi:hypothetical protein D6C84_05796 [Aureobasidium pullulans]|uniref:Uncharacterized protein n=1 Tax=Aureobasidium pullulans TaxID=5580 RepID=A0A4S9XQX6_AURPU|nr:hypothetical protein D6C84_05796 [Aureobasidium pullulans]
MRSAKYAEEVYLTQNFFPDGALCTPVGTSGSHASTFGAMKFSNAGSTAEGSSTKRSPLSPVKPVGSGFPSPSRVSAPLVQGPVFSTDTDTDPNTSETRFVCFDLIPEQWTQEYAEGWVLNRALEYTGLIGLIDNAVVSPSRTMSHLPTKMERQDSGNPADNRKTLQSAGSSAWLMYTSRLIKQDFSANWLDWSPRPGGVALEWISTFNTFSRTHPMDLRICNERCRLWRVL